MALHTHLQPGDIHIIYNWEYDDQTERENATDFIASDVGKLARQKSDETLWMLLDNVNPSWAPVAGGHEFTGDSNFVNDVEVDGVATFNGNVVVGDSSGDTLTVNSTIVSDLLPTDCTYQLGNESNKWLDGYFCLFTPTQYTPVGSNSSLEGHLKGIDGALDSILSSSHPRGVYIATSAEAAVEEVDSSRAVDQGIIVDVGSLTDEQFRDEILIYLNGQLLYNDPSPAANSNSVQNDIARKTGSLSTIVFSANIRTGAVIQIVRTKSGS